jgi:hypothetical protein
VYGVWCGAITASGVGRSCSFMAQSIAYDQERIFFGTGSRPCREVLKSEFLCISHINWIFTEKSDVGLGGEGVTRGGHQEGHRGSPRGSPHIFHTSHIFSSNLLDIFYPLVG